MQVIKCYLSIASILPELATSLWLRINSLRVLQAESTYSTVNGFSTLSGIGLEATQRPSVGKECHTSSSLRETSHLPLSLLHIPTPASSYANFFRRFRIYLKKPEILFLEVTYMNIPIISLKSYYTEIPAIEHSWKCTIAIQLGGLLASMMYVEH